MAFHVCAAAFAILSVAAAAVGQDQVQLDEAPKGFRWQKMKEISGAVLVPEGWHFSKASTKDVLVYRVTKEKFGKDPFLTGLTINVLTDVSKKTNVTPFLYGTKYIRDYMKGAEVAKTPKVDKVAGFRRITCYVVKKLPKVDKTQLFRVRVTILANDKTETLYVLLFGSPKDDWAKTYAIGKQLFRSIVLSVKPISAAATADKAKAASLNRTRMYVPIPRLTARFGEDAEPLGNYIKILEKTTADFLSKEKHLKAKGLFIAVGIKSEKKTRVWCQAVEGEIQADLIMRLEKRLAKVEAIHLKKSPAAFAMELNLFGKKPAKFPEFPTVWLKAAKEKKVKFLVPPDELFKVIWPD